MNKLIRGDARAEMRRLAEQGVVVDAVITDPPYYISQKNNFDTIKGKNGKPKFGSIDFGEWDKSSDRADLVAWLGEADALLKHGGNIVIFCSWKDTTIFVDKLDDMGYLVKNMIQWVKSNSEPKNRDRLYIVNYEVAIWATKGKGWTFNRLDPKKQNSQFYYPFVTGKEKTSHPTQKSLGLTRDLVSIHTNEGDVILDPFMGSGTTCKAAQSLDRKFIGIETNEEYFDIAVDRLLHGAVRL